jgi:cell division septal protein FtsQ
MQQYIKYVEESHNLKNRKKILEFNIQYLLRIVFFLLILGLWIFSYKNSSWTSYFRIQIKTNFDIDDTNNNINHFYNDLEKKYLWDINVQKVRTKFLELVKLKNVSIKIILPNILYISGFERNPYAIWWDYNKFYLVDDEGVILSDNVTEEDKNKYILVVGENAIDNLGKIITIISASKQNGKVASLRFIGQRRWDLALNNGTILKLPENNELSAINLFETLLKLKVNLINSHAIVDMRLAPDKVFITNKKKY